MPSPTAPSPDDEPRPKKPYVSPWIPVSLVSLRTHLSDVHNIRAPACHNLSGPGGPPSHAAPTPKRASTPGTLRRILDGSSAPPPRRATVRNPGAAGSSRVPRSAASSSSPSSHTLSSAPPPRRVNRSSTVAIPGFVSRAPTTPPTSPTKPSVANSSQNKATEADDSFNAPLYILKAFSIATGLVVAGGVTVVWGVKTYLGVRDTEEFAARMRYTLRTSMPFLASRIHRPPSSEPLPPTFPFSSPSPSDVTSTSSSASPETSISSSPGDLQTDTEPWSWSAAQARLSKAYDTGGIIGWMEAAALEMEMEADVERRKRGVWVGARAPAGENIASSR